MFVIIDSGHGGADPGGGSNEMWKEKDLALKISKYQKMRLDMLNIPSSLTRSTDVFLSPSTRVNIINTIASDKTNPLLISNHINNGGGKGAEVIYSIRSSPLFGNYVANEMIKAGQSIRNVYTRKNEKGTDYYFILRDTPYTDSNIIEYGFASNEVDKNLLFYNWPVLAEAVIRAICDYYNIIYYPPNFIVHIVRKGDTLYSLAKSYNTTIDKIMENNNLTSKNIDVGQELYIY